MSFNESLSSQSLPAPFFLPDEELRKDCIRIECESDHLFFSCYFFKHRQGIKFRVNWHHHVIAAALQRVLDGESKNLVINVPPGSSKTELAVINFMARGLALNPDARFLHISSGDDLVLLNSQTVRDIVLGDEFQELWPMKIADDAKAKKRWNVIKEVTGRHGQIRLKKAGGIYAVALGGQITGFRAGHMTPGFQGAIIIDDPLKADDAFSEAKVKQANRRLLSTVKSRRANPDTPIIVIMQRVGEKDPAGFIRGGNMPGDWEFVTIPALINDAYVAALPADVRQFVTVGPKDKDGRFSYWEYKEPLKELLALETGTGVDSDGNRVSRFVFNSQYMQAPIAMGGNIIHGQKFMRVKMLPELEYRIIYADTAQKTKEANDYSVFQCWGKGKNGKVYLIDQVRGKWEAPDLRQKAIDFWLKHKDAAQFPPSFYGALRSMKVEDKSSGTGLIQDLHRNQFIPVKGIERNKDKLTRVMDVVSYIDSGLVCLLDGQAYIADYIAECEAFTADDTHAHDDQIDPTCDAISDMIGPKPRGWFDV